MSDGVDLRVLVVDDEKEMRSFVRLMLGQCGIRNIDEAENGEEAAEKLSDAFFSKPDLIITDLHMEKMDGLGLLNLIRRGKTLVPEYVPIIVLTGDQDSLVHEVSQQVGATTILTKPISADSLTGAVRTLFPFLP